jgi:hypothetical protein
VRVRGHEWRVDWEWDWPPIARPGYERHGDCHALYLGPLTLYLFTRWEERQAWLDALWEGGE